MPTRSIAGSQGRAVKGRSPLRAALLLFALGNVLAVGHSVAQTANPSHDNIPSDPSTAYDQAIDVPPDPNATEAYHVPDIPKGWLAWTKHDGKYASYKLSVVGLLDRDDFWQDNGSLSQVGGQASQWDLRSFRLSLGGLVKVPKLPVKYLLAFEYKGFDRPPGAKGWGSTDISITAPIVKKKYGELTFGKTKETTVYEMVGDAANLSVMERWLNPFFTSRNVGFRYNNTFLHDNMTVSGGWYNDWWTKENPYTGSSNHFTGRITGVPIYSKDGANYLHLGFAERQIGATNGTLQFTGRPESNVTSVYVDTGKFAARSSTQYSFEVLANRGPVAVLYELVEATTNAYTVENPHFSGYYVTGSWVITGEHHPYDKTVGYARRIIPEHKYGAWELVGRVGKLDLSSKSIQGGKMMGYSANVSWWPNRRIRSSLGFGSYDLDKLGVVGTTNQLHFRLQYVY